MDEEIIRINLALVKLMEIADELEKHAERILYSYLPIRCPDCNSLNVCIIGRTPKRLKFYCRDCGRNFQKSVKVLDRTFEEVLRVEEEESFV